jgi:hypothetical protein
MLLVFGAAVLWDVRPEVCGAGVGGDLPAPADGGTVHRQAACLKFCV